MYVPLYSSPDPRTFTVLRARSALPKAPVSSVPSASTAHAERSTTAWQYVWSSPESARPVSDGSATGCGERASSAPSDPSAVSDVDEIWADCTDFPEISTPPDSAVGGGGI